MVNKNHSSNAAEKTKTPQASWPDFAVGLYDKLSGRGAQITYEFDDLNIFIPAKLGETDHFHWKLSGTVNIRSEDEVNQETTHD